MPMHDMNRSASPAIHMPRLTTLVVMAGIVAVVVGCSAPKKRAPVESRSVPKAGATVPRGVAPAVTVAPMVSAPAPDGFYRVRRGDTLIGISLDHGVAWRDLASWNQIDNPNLIEVDQLLRVRPPSSTTIASAPKTLPDTKPQTEVRPLSGARTAPAAPAASPPAAAASAPAPASAAPPANTAANTAAIPKAADSISLAWPTQGQVITQFSDPGYKGIALAGVEGDPIVAAGDGRVVYSGNGLRGYGNLVIVKHEGDFLTAYAHNKTILVAEGQTVKRGQKIAELGKTDSDVPKLHFEVRRSGKPVDPLRFLAQR
jgi:lipoprotein NlpD